MRTDTIEMFNLPPPAKRLGSQKARLGYALEIYSGRGHTLKTLSGPKYLGRSVVTLKKYCRDLKLKFPDYCPRELEVKDEEKL
jgi:hypothetical protein